MAYYAVAKGKQTGVFETWDECRAQTTGFKGAVYQKFKTRAEAQAFVDAAAAHTATEETVVKEPFVPDYYVYTDGACSNNGGVGASAGIGVYFGPNDPRNVSLKLEGKQTNNVAELTAIQKVYSIVQGDLAAGKRVCIASDSVYAIRCVTTYGRKCSDRGWRDDIPNKELVKSVFELYKDLGASIQFMHVRAHTQGTDPHSIGNDGADRLANAAIGLEECPYAAPQRIYLNVPYAQKDYVKAHGGRWDPKSKQWYIAPDTPHKEDLLRRFASQK